jgi:chitinase
LRETIVIIIPENRGKVNKRGNFFIKMMPNSKYFQKSGDYVCRFTLEISGDYGSFDIVPLG